MRSRSRRTRESQLDDAGFSMVEVVVAVGLIFSVLVSMAYVATMSLTDIAAARDRQTATGLANETIEQVRALPFDTLKAGLSNTDLATSDPQITTSGGVYSFNGERIPTGTNPGVKPLVPHRTTSVVNRTSYTIGVYPTHYLNNTSSGVYRVVVRVAWAASSKRSGRTLAELQSVFYSPVGCQSTATHPFAAPCQPFLYSTAGSGAAAIDMTPLVAGVQGVAGLDIDRMSLKLTSHTRNLQNEQVAAVQSQAAGSGASIMLLGQAEQAAGASQVSASADNDPARSSAPYDSRSNVPAGSQTISLSGGGNSASVVSSGLDTASAIATVAQGAPNLCPDLSNLTTANNLSCGSASTEQLGTMSANVNIASVGLGTIALGSVGPSALSRSWGDRIVAPIGTSCPGTSGEGCVRVLSSRYIGQVLLGGLPSSLPSGKQPAGWGGYLVRMTGHGETVSAESGLGTKPPSVTAEP